MAVMTIVCGTDLSETSAAVVATAASISRVFGADLELFHALVLPPSYPPDVVAGELADNLVAAAEASIRAQAAAAGGGATIRTCVKVGGPDLLVHHARQTGSELLVVGTHARRGAAHLLLGSVAERTLRAAPCPTLVVPPTGRSALQRPGARPGRLKVVAGVDFSPASDAALAWLKKLCDHVDCDVRLVHLYRPAAEHERLGLSPPRPFEIDPEAVTALARDLRPRIQALTGTDFALRVRPFWGGEDDPLAWEAETDDADLLIIGTSQTRHSTALPTVRGAHLPVVCVPATPAAVVSEGPAAIRTVLVPIDFSPAAASAVLEAFRLLLPTGGDIVLAHVAQPDGAGLDPSRQEEIETCLLGLVPAGLQVPQVRTRTLVVADAAPGEAIVKAARRVGADLIVLAARGNTERREARSMVTDHVVWNAERRVLVVPPPKSQKA